jgi:putative phosphoribosyl transferase
MPQESVRLDIQGVTLAGDLHIPPRAIGLVIFAHGSGSSRFSPRNRFVADILHKHFLGTLLIDLLTPEEERVDEVSRELRFNIPMLAERLVGIADWAHAQPQLAAFDIGYFGASTGGGAALIAAALRPQLVHAVVSRGGRPDLAAKYLPQVKAPTLLLVGEHDPSVITMNERAQHLMNAVNELKIIPGATHLFEEPGTLEKVADNAADWFSRHLLSKPLKKGAGYG